jgi:uncharacterized protein YbbC (DUF1343 family)/CubicO group peptidase (beta-lactamase class C family)
MNVKRQLAALNPHSALDYPSYEGIRGTLLRVLKEQLAIRLLPVRYPSVMKLFWCALACAAAALAQSFPATPKLDAAIAQAIREDRIPGAVLIVGHNGQVVHRKAYGSRAVVPRPEAMTADTIFDCASLTKVLVTTPALMKLFEAGKLQLDARVTDYLPEFQGGESAITIRNLFTHFSGLRPDLDPEPAWSGYQTGIQLALKDKPAGPPGARFVYSDINFILLGEVARRLSGQTLDRYARQTIFDPLGMSDSMFQPATGLRGRIAPTEAASPGEAPLRGVVHDPTARAMGGIAGHAGLFSTADDLARFAQMMLDKGGRIFNPPTVEMFTSPQSPPDQPVVRGLGWDIDSPYSSNRGDLFPLGSYGHTGFTGTSLWIDPYSRTYVILLASSVHPNRRPPITALRNRVATIAAAALGADQPGIEIEHPARDGKVLTGLDVLEEQNFAPLKGKKVGLITNQTGLDRAGGRNVDRMLAAGVKVISLFAPEHGVSGSEDRENLDDSTDAATGLKVWSLYKEKNRRPSAEMLRGIDTLVFDIQDIGTRFYTYVSTMAYALEAAASRRIPIYILDRPDPITGTRVEGPVLDRENQSFTGYFPMPIRYGMTIAELAGMFNAENRLRADLRVIEMKNWTRGDWFDSTGLRWVDPSPNLRSLTAALLYPGVAMLESSTNYSVGRGTDVPFEVIGSDFIHGRELAVYLNARRIPGLRAYPIRFRPASSNFSGVAIEGVRFVITNRELFDSVRLGLEIAAALEKLYPGKISFAANRKLIGAEATVRALQAGEDPRAIEQRLEAPLREFLQMRDKYLRYR